MSNTEEPMVYVKAIHSNVMIGSAILFEGDYRLATMSSAIEKLESLHYVKTFKTEKEAADYMYEPLSKKGLDSASSFAPRPVMKELSPNATESAKAEAREKHARSVEEWEKRRGEAKVTPFGDPTAKALGAEKSANEGARGDSDNCEGDTSGGADSAAETVEATTSTATHKRHRKN